MTLSFEELKSLVVLNLLGERRRVVDCLEQGMTPSEVLATQKVPGPFFGLGQKRDPVPSGFAETFDPEKEIKRCEELGVRLLTWFDADYPRLLKEIYDPPLVLYIKGSFIEGDAAAVAIVGTRHPSFYGRNQARQFGRELAQAGLSIVSGFARGIDQIAHQAALEISHGRTIAILGCGMDVEYPQGSQSLFERIAAQGAMVSEYPLGTPPRAENFPRRNRIISGLSLGVLVVEAAMKSGSLITAHEACEQGREVFALPGPVDQLTSRGTNHLIKEGAALVVNAEDILQGIGGQLLSHKSSLSASPSLRAESEAISNLETEVLTPMSSPNTFGEEHPVLPEKCSRIKRACDLVGDPSATNHGGPLKPCGNDIHMDSKIPEEEELMKVLSSQSLSSEEIAARSSLAPWRVISLLTQLEIQRKIQKSHDGRFSMTAAGR